MTTAATPVARPAAAATSRAEAAPGVRFSALLRLEARKLVDTRAALWLLLGTLALSLTVTITGVSIPFPGRPPLTFGGIAADGVQAAQLLLPLTALLLATSEWTQHGALVTFALEPRRLRVVAAKFVVATALALAASAVLVALAAVVAAGTALAGQPLSWAFDATLAWAVFSTVLVTWQGLGLGLLLMNTAAAIGVYFLLPAFINGAALISPAVAEVLSWLNLTTAFGSLMPGGVGEVSWPKVVVSFGFWVVLPLVAGAWRTLHREAS